MQIQAYEGYFENGSFFPVGQAVSIPERRRVFVTVLNEPIADAEKQRDAILARGMEAMREMQEISLANGNSEMTLDEINAIIAEVRKEMREEQNEGCC